MTPRAVAHQTPLYMGFPGKNTGVGRHFLLQGIFPIQGPLPHLLHWQADILPLSHQGSLGSLKKSFFFFYFKGSFKKNTALESHWLLWMWVFCISPWWSPVSSRVEGSPPLSPCSIQTVSSRCSLQALREAWMVLHLS